MRSLVRNPRGLEPLGCCDIPAEYLAAGRRSSAGGGVPRVR